MDWLRRSRAPWGDGVWKELDEAVVRVARHFLAARHVADFDGPHGWDFVAVRLGTTHESPTENQSPRAQVTVPEVVLLSEVECSFYQPLALVDVWERGGPTLDTSAAEAAAREVANAEDRLAFYGHNGGTGFLNNPQSPALDIGDWTHPAQIASDVLNAVAKLDASGIPGPYSLVLDEAHYYTYLA
ncbi:MAG TPA: family 1 encapsulin nanocompartment shell protein, partial [Candidatus Xenobia bacterium]